MPKELLYGKSFKKYKDEYEPKVVDYVREWAKNTKLMAFHEDKSLVKVTGTKSQITGLMAELLEKFDYVPPEDRKEDE